MTDSLWRIGCQAILLFERVSELLTWLGGRQRGEGRPGTQHPRLDPWNISADCTGVDRGGRLYHWPMDAAFTEPRDQGDPASDRPQDEDGDLLEEELLVEELSIDGICGVY